MQIHPYDNLQLSALGAGREEAQEIQARRATGVRRRRSADVRVLDAEGALPGIPRRVEAYSKEGEARRGNDEAFGRLFSAKA